MTNTPTCYMCDAPATSREHAPPSCFFPEAATFGRELRKNLVTVPSCDSHNCKKSNDDEFYRAAILMATAQHSAAGKHQFFQKLLAASARSPQVYGAFFVDRGIVAEGTGRALKLDRGRFDRCVDRMTRALFFDGYQRKWMLPIAVVSPNFYSTIDSGQVVPHQLSAATAEVSRRFLSAEPIRGENPEVFSYQLKFDQTTESFGFAGTFYGLFEIYAYSSKAMAERAS